MKERGDIFRTVIEHFLLMQSEGNSDRIVYYDQQGNRFEKDIPSNSINHALKKFDGKPRAIVRSTGGISRAIPYQLVISDGEGTDPSVRIKVKFIDLKRGSQGELLGTEASVGTKVVTPEELMEPFSFSLEGHQRFLADFGQGVVPIYVFRYGMDERGKPLSLFVELDDIERVLFGGRERLISVQAYRLHRDCLRFALNMNGVGRDEYDVALDNYRRMKEAGREIVPAFMKLAQPVETPTNLTFQDFRRYMSRALRQLDIPELQIETITDLAKEKVNGLEMYPFGVFEMR